MGRAVFMERQCRLATKVRVNINVRWIVDIRARARARARVTNNSQHL